MGPVHALRLPAAPTELESGAATPVTGWGSQSVCSGPDHTRPAGRRHRPRSGGMPIRSVWSRDAREPSEQTRWEATGDPPGPLRRDATEPGAGRACLTARPVPLRDGRDGAQGAYSCAENKLILKAAGCPAACREFIGTVRLVSFYSREIMSLADIRVYLLGRDRK